jgi:hypothetical protein
MQRAGFPLVLALAFIAGIGPATAQNAPSQPAGAAAGQKSPLTEEQKRAISQALKSEQPQTMPAGTQAQVGKKLPEVMKLRPLPPEVLAVVPDAPDVLYVRLPDRILLLDPHTQITAEIILDSATTSGTRQ